MIDYTGFQFGKGTPRVLSRIDKKLALEAAEKACRQKVKARDKGQCFFPRCRVVAREMHHIVSRSVRGKTIWNTEDILSACREHHQLFKAGLIRVEGNPDVAQVIVRLTQAGKEAGLRIPRRTDAT